jgi:hypothetical protein
MQIAGQAERMAAGVDELLQRISALGGIADHGNPGAGPDAGDAGPQMRKQEFAVLQPASSGTIGPAACIARKGIEVASP